MTMTEHQYRGKARLPNRDDLLLERIRCKCRARLIDCRYCHSDGLGCVWELAGSLVGLSKAPGDSAS